ncbi:hypothetical protein T484DRAFT_3578859 [Baffinella frigidus]|nr:hypothetical protein T484DRAFT_3578859 [Cryptophyta sp. CCMP2293]
MCQETIVPMRPSGASVHGARCATPRPCASGRTLKAGPPSVEGCGSACHSSTSQVSFQVPSGVFERRPCLSSSASATPPPPHSPTPNQHMQQPQLLQHAHPGDLVHLHAPLPPRGSAGARGEAWTVMPTCRRVHGGGDSLLGRRARLRGDGSGRGDGEGAAADDLVVVANLPPLCRATVVRGPRPGLCPTPQNKREREREKK